MSLGAIIEEGWEFIAGNPYSDSGAELVSPINADGSFQGVADPSKTYQLTPAQSSNLAAADSAIRTIDAQRAKDLQPSSLVPTEVWVILGFAAAIAVGLYVFNKSGGLAAFKGKLPA